MNLRVAIVCNAAKPRAWQAACVEALVAGGATIAGVFVDESGGERAKPHGRPHDVAAAMRRVEPPEAWRKASPFDNATADAAGKACADAYGITGADAHGITGADAHGITGADAHGITGADAHGKAPTTDPDLTLYLGDGERPQRAFPGARYGTWWFRWRTPLGFWELLRGEHVVEAALECGDAGPIKRGWFEAVSHSLAQTVDNVCFGAASWPSQACRELAEGLALDRAKGDRREPLAAREPNALDRVALSCSLAWRALLLRLGYIFRHEHWNVGVVNRPIADCVDGFVASDVAWLAFPPTGSFRADPFGRKGSDGLIVLCEGYDYRDRCGYIAATLLREDRDVPDWRSIVREPFHLSYPYLVERGAAVYCCPEMSESGEIALYEARDFPFSWERRATLVSGFAGADSTIFQHEERWWLLCTPAEAANRNLYVWYAEDLFGPWTPHARNPVKIDARSARPGGTPFTRDGRLYRPAQDCAGTYGGRIAIMHVRVLTPVDFDEVRVAFVEPDPRGLCPDGLHTLSAAGDVTLVDGKYHRFVARECYRTLSQYAAKAARALGLQSKGR